MSSSKASIKTQTFCINVKLLNSTCKDHKAKPRDKRFIFFDLLSATVVYCLVKNIIKAQTVNNYGVSLLNFGRQAGHFNN